MESTLQQRAQQNDNAIDLFENHHGPRGAAALRKSRQREMLAELSQKLAHMLDKLEAVLKIDRERAVAVLAEYSGLLEIAVEDISRIRDIDERFGGKGRRVPRIATLAEKLEKGVAYLFGICSVAGSGENLSPYNWKLIERDVQMVLGVARMIELVLSPPAIKEAA